MRILESAENYLETIFMLRRKSDFVRAIDVANHLSFTKASVSIALKNLREHGYISVEPSGNIVLLPSGLEIAEKGFERHQFLSVALMLLGVDEETATGDACRIEHVISEETFQAIKKHVGKMYKGKPIKDMF